MEDDGDEEVWLSKGRGATGSATPKRPREEKRPVGTPAAKVPRKRLRIPRPELGGRTIDDVLAELFGQGFNRAAELLRAIDDEANGDDIGLTQKNVSDWIGRWKRKQHRPLDVHSRR